jgi:predicted transposase YdaD
VEREIRTIWDRIADEAHQQGLQQGLQEGLQQGTLQTLSTVKKILLDALRDKFGEVPVELRRKIEEETDEGFLWRVLHKAIVAKNLEELLTQFK